jgi:hypothetical protein
VQAQQLVQQFALECVEILRRIAQRLALESQLTFRNREYRIRDPTSQILSQANFHRTFERKPRGCQARCLPTALISAHCRCSPSRSRPIFRVMEPEAANRPRVIMADERQRVESSPVSREMTCNGVSVSQTVERSLALHG